MSKIYNGKDLAKRDGYESQRDWITAMCRKLGTLLDTPFTGRVSGEAVKARIDFGRWIADCECGGHEYVSHEEKIFYCFSCGNREQGGDARPVVFPAEKDRREIEQLLLQRTIDDRMGINDLDRALKARPVNLPRNWSGETLAELRKQNKQEVKNGV